MIAMTGFLLGFKSYTAKLLKKYNALAYEEKEKKQALLQLLFGENRHRGICWNSVYLRLRPEYLYRE